MLRKIIVFLANTLGSGVGGYTKAATFDWDSEEMMLSDVAQEVFNLLNRYHDEMITPNPVLTKYRAEGYRSMSIGDVVEIDGVQFRCASLGWKKLDIKVVDTSEPTIASSAPVRRHIKMAEIDESTITPQVTLDGKVMISFPGKIDMIKAVRAPGVGLKEAKAQVDELVKEIGELMVERFNAIQIANWGEMQITTDELKTYIEGVGNSFINYDEAKAVFDRWANAREPF